MRVAGARTKAGGEEGGMKRIRLTVEWDGACSEYDWGAILAEEIEDVDASGTTRVVDIEHITNEGTTEVVPDVEREVAELFNPRRPIRSVLRAMRGR